MKEEIWKPVVGWEENYQVSSLGKIKNINSKSNFFGRILSPRKHYSYNKKYISLSVLLYCKSVKKESMISRLVAQAFIPNPENKKEVNHIDFNAENNHVSNLEWVTHKENMQHSLKGGRFDFLKINIKKIDEIKRLTINKKTPLEIATIFGCSRESLYSISKLYGFSLYRKLSHENLMCHQCSTIFKRKIRTIKLKHHFCTQRCFGKFYSK